MPRVGVGLRPSIVSVQHLAQVIRRPAERLGQGRQGMRPTPPRIGVVLQLAQGRQGDPRLGSYLHLSRAQFSQASADRARNGRPVLCHLNPWGLCLIKVSGRIDANRARDGRRELTLMSIDINIGVNEREAVASELALAPGGAMTTATSLAGTSGRSCARRERRMTPNPGPAWHCSARGDGLDAILVVSWCGRGRGLRAADWDTEYRPLGRRGSAG